MRRTCKRRPWQGGFFLLPNEIFTLGLSAGEIAVYAYLLFCEDREAHVCYPSFRKIGERTGMSPNTVRKYITQLEDKHLIETLPTTVWTLMELRETGRCFTRFCSFMRRSIATWNASWRDCRKRSAPGNDCETKHAPVRPCVRFWGAGRNDTRYQRSTRQALLETCEPVVDESSKTEEPQVEQEPAPPPLGGGVSPFWGEKRTRPCAALCAVLEAG